MSRLLLLPAVALCLLFAACGGGEPDRGTTAATGSGTFPVTIEHRYGTMTVPEAPKRVVSIGLTEQDILYQLGVKPVGVNEWYGDQPYATWPWATAARGDARPTVLSRVDGFQFEKIAALRPDLIVGTNAGMERRDYDRLSKIAPTLAGLPDWTDNFPPWDQQAELVARAVGKAAEGEKIVADTKAAYAKVAAEHPDFAGKTATFAQGGFYQGLLYAYPPGLNTEFLSMLGFEVNPKLTPLAPKPGSQAEVSEERADVLDADALVFAVDKPADISDLLKRPTIEQLGAVEDNSTVYTDTTLSGALYFMTPLSLRYVLDRLPDELQAALDGRSPRRPVGSD